MLQRARKADSRSFLRELEFALILVRDTQAREHFLGNLSDVFRKRNDPNARKTGERDAKSEILAYLNQKGYTQTANVWARALDIDRKSLKNLLQILQTRLLEHGAEGVVEIHLQDREINSPHIQYVGIKAEQAEQIIAQTLVELRYETSLENALSKKEFRPYFKINPKTHYPKHNDLDDEIKARQDIEKWKNSDEQIDKLVEAFDEKMKVFKNELSLKQESRKQAMLNAQIEGIKQDNNRKLQALRTRRKVSKLRRLRRK